MWLAGAKTGMSIDEVKGVWVSVFSVAGLLEPSCDTEDFVEKYVLLPWMN